MKSEKLLNTIIGTLELESKIIVSLTITEEELFKKSKQYFKGFEDRITLKNEGQPDDN